MQACGAIGDCQGQQNENPEEHGITYSPGFYYLVKVLTTDYIDLYNRKWLGHIFSTKAGLLVQGCLWDRFFTKLDI